MSNQKPVDVQLEKVHKLVRDDILQEKDREQQDPKRILLTVTYNRFNRTLQQLFANIGTSFKLTTQRELFQEHPTTAFKRNKNLKEII